MSYVGMATSLSTEWVYLIPKVQSYYTNNSNLDVASKKDISSIKIQNIFLLFFLTKKKDLKFGDIQSFLNHHQQDCMNAVWDQWMGDRYSMHT